MTMDITAIVLAIISFLSGLGWMLAFAQSTVISTKRSAWRDLDPSTSVHLLHVFERAVAEVDDVCMIEMGIGSEERMFWGEFEVHDSVWFSLFIL